MTARSILVTRPGAGGRALALELADGGADAIWWPAFELSPSDDPEALAATAARLARYDLVVFVSPAAVRFGAAALPQLGGAGCTFGAVGAGTRAEIERVLKIPAARIVAPPDGAGGSEALLARLADAGTANRARAAPIQRVLVLRAESGRELLADELAQRAAAVDQVAVYRRCVRHPLADECAALVQRARAGGPVAALVTSSEAVTVLEEQWARLDGVAAWMHQGTALASHQRIEQRLRQAGYRRVLCCEPSADAILAALAG